MAKQSTTIKTAKEAEESLKVSYPPVEPTSTTPEEFVSEIDKDPATMEVLKVEPTPAPTTPAAPKVVWPEYDEAGFANCQNISQRIRFLNTQGPKWTRGTIAKFLTELRGRKVLYQHVRNVLITPLSKKDA